MAGKTLPKYLLLLATMTLIGTAIMLAVFYGQYRWLTADIVAVSVEQHEDTIAAGFAQKSGAEISSVATQIAALQSFDSNAVALLLNTGVAEFDELEGIRFRDNAGLETTVGTLGAEPDRPGPLWTGDNLYLMQPVIKEGREVGQLTGRFSLAMLAEEADAFEERLVSSGTQSQNVSFLWITIATIATLIICGFIIWTVARMQSQRIRDLKVQAEKLRDADFGEPLKVVHDDQLGDLAAVFNEMRDKLKRTTISRDYVDNVLSSMNEAIIVTSDEDKITRVNAATSRMLGYKDDELIGHSIDLIVDKKKGTALQSSSQVGVPQEAFLLAKTGERIPVSYTSSTIESSNEPHGHRIYAAQNISERRKAEQRIRYLARIDALTKVPNRMQFQHLLQRSIARARKANGSICLLYIDIDHFKDINDTFGHVAGDAALETVAERLTNALPNDAVVGRLAGDEFAVIVEHANSGEIDKKSVDLQARELLDHLAEPFPVQGNEVFMTASMGIAGYPEDAPNVIDLIRNADAALYHSKKAGGNVHSYYAAEMNEAAVERLMTKSKLKRAFERDELLVHYQPKYNLQTGEVFGAEALVRWELPERGIILPSDFIPIAEETNLIIEIGEWVLDRVCEDFRYWQRCVASAGRVSVNLSLKQLRQPNFINRISAILRSYEVSPTSLELEITETTLMENPERTIKILDELYSLGLHLAIDDFGTGYSSLSALQQFPISTLKVDKSFVKNIAHNPDDATIVGTIIHMGQNLKMDVVAEGVETSDQLSHLQSLDCTYVQGLLFGEPMSSDNYLELLMAQKEGTDKYKILFA